MIHLIKGQFINYFTDRESREKKILLKINEFCRTLQQLLKEETKPRCD